MAKPSKLDRVIAEAQKDYDKAMRECELKGAVLNALGRAKEPAEEDETFVPRVKRTRKPKGLPKPEEARPS